VQTPHDHLFRRLFARPAAVGALLRCFLPRGFVASVRWRTLRPWPARTVDRRLRAHLPDGVQRAARRGRRSSVYLVHEHKSGDAPRVALQVLRYEVQLLDHLHRRGHRGRLPLVVPIVWSHGVRNRAATDAGDLLEPPPEALRRLRRRWPFLLVDLSRWPEAAMLRARLPSFARLVVLFLQYLAFRPRRGVVAALHRWAGPLRALARTPAGREDLETLSSYILFTTDLPAGALDRVLRRVVGSRGASDMITTAERLLRQGRREGMEKGLEKGLHRGMEKGLQKGRRKGLHEGQHSGRIELLLTILEGRFGKLDRRTKNRIRRAKLADLDRWARALLVAESLDELFAA